MNQASLLVALAATLVVFIVNVEAASKPCDEDVFVPLVHPSMDFRQKCRSGCAQQGMEFVPQKAPIYHMGAGKLECCCALIPGTYAYKAKYETNSDKKRGYDDDDDDDDYSGNKKSKYRGYGENKRGHDDDGEGSSQKKSRWFPG